MKILSILFVLMILSGCTTPSSPDEQINQSFNSREKMTSSEDQPDIQGIVSSVFEGGINIALMEPRGQRGHSKQEDRESMRQRFRDMSDEERQNARDKMLKNATKRKEVRFTQSTEFFEGRPWEEKVPLDPQTIQPHMRINVWLDENGNAKTIFITPFSNQRPE